MACDDAGMEKSKQTFVSGSVVRAANPATGEIESGTVVKYTSHKWLHVQFSTGEYRVHPSEVLPA